MSVRLRSRLAGIGVALATAVAGLAVTAAPAYAASSSCTTPYFYGSTRSCTTGAISYNSAGKYVALSWDVCETGSKWQVINASTGKVVSSGTIKTKKDIYIVYVSAGNYKARIYDACYLDTMKIFS
jgi:hypothetical protein